MPTPPNQKPPPAAVPRNESIEDPTSKPAEKEAEPEAAYSEVSMRLRLLGKLIIPPAPR